MQNIQPFYTAIDRIKSTPDTSGRNDRDLTQLSSQPLSPYVL